MRYSETIRIENWSFCRERSAVWLRKRKNKLPIFGIIQNQNRYDCGERNQRVNDRDVKNVIWKYNFDSLLDYSKSFGVWLSSIKTEINSVKLKTWIKDKFKLLIFTWRPREKKLARTRMETAELTASRGRFCLSSIFPSSAFDHDSANEILVFAWLTFQSIPSNAWRKWSKLLFLPNNIHEKISPFRLVKSSAVFFKTVQKRVNSVQKEETSQAFWLAND